MMNESNFKKLLEYFVTHLMFKQNGDSQQVTGYNEYLAPLGNFCHTGNGYNGGNIQRQVSQWDIYNNTQVCINVQGNYGDYTTKKCYLNWLGTGINVYAKWDKNKSYIIGLYLGYYFWWEGKFLDKPILDISIADLGLYDNNPPNQNLIDFYKKFEFLYIEYKNNQGIYYIKERKHNMKKYTDLLTSNKNIILTGAPGTGKTYLAQQIAEAMGATGNQYGFVQFHPSYDYSDFMEGLRPIKGTSNINFERKDGIFMAFCRKALAAKQAAIETNESIPNYVFVIDEINRGEMSKILGELFFSIDPSYRGIKGKVSTQYANLWNPQDLYDGSYEFYIPDNVFIIGTMNDIDRSVESMDFAMRRRFAFIEICADDRISMIKEDHTLVAYYDDIIQRMLNLNLAILAIGLTSAYQIGASYYLKLRNYLNNKQEVDNYSWDCLWNNHIYGLLFEYLRGLPNASKDLAKLRSAFCLNDFYEKDEQTGEVQIKSN